MKYNSALVVVLALLHPSHRRLMARDVLTFRFFFFSLSLNVALLFFR